MIEHPKLPNLVQPKIVVKKSLRKLELLDGTAMVRVYDVGLGRSPIGDKEIEGDGKTPEGDFYIFGKNPKSKYSLGLGISYPNTEDARRGLGTSLIEKTEFDAIMAAIENSSMPPQKTRLGGEIYIHDGGSHDDWTQGCIAMSDGDIRELYDAVDVSTPVVILP